VGLKSLADFRKLERLSLEGTLINNSGLHHLSELKTLKGLSLKQTNVTAEAVASLQTALPQCEIVAEP
jgi:hypothetical protein